MDYNKKNGDGFWYTFLQCSSKRCVIKERKDNNDNSAVTKIFDIFLTHSCLKKYFSSNYLCNSMYTFIVAFLFVYL